MVTVLSRVPVDEIRERAASIHFGRLLLTLFVGLFWCVGWSARMAYRALQFLAAAVMFGWADAAPKAVQRQ